MAADEPRNGIHPGTADDDAGEPVGLVDIAEISLAQLRQVDAPVLAKSIARLLREASDPDDTASSFNSAV
jgi:FXSXX-COOH protein